MNKIQYRISDNGTIQRLFEFGIHHRLWVVVSLHIIVFFLSYYCAYFLKFDQVMPLDILIRTLPILIILRLVVFSYFQIFQGMFRYTSFYDIMNILKAATLSSLIFVIYLIFSIHLYLLAVVIIDWILLLLLAGFIRLLLKYIRFSLYRLPLKKRTLVAGSMDECITIVGLLKESEDVPLYPVACLGFRSHQNLQHVQGVEIVRQTDEIEKIFIKYNVQEVLIGSSLRYSKELNRIAEACGLTNICIRILPPLSDFFDDFKFTEVMHNINVADLIEREAVNHDDENIKTYIKGKSILVTGAGGSIGRQLCLQIARYHPRLIILLERFENNLHRVEVELKAEFCFQNVRSFLTSINNSEEILKVLKEESVDIIFHCAAHKHVRFLENHPMEAGYNNVIGTRSVAMAAERAGVEKFIMVSTDKAVQPTNIMGASKKIAEMYIQSLNNHSRTKYITVRFGNVLNSEGSVIPIFTEQIKKGGPVTVTHPDMERFFMTIPESCQLILQALFMGQGGEIFVLEMGNQVKILEIAERMIRMAGKMPNTDVPIVFIGLQEGEKLKEELFNSDEIPEPTASPFILMASSQRNDHNWLVQEVQEIEKLIFQRNEIGLVQKFRDILPGYTSEKFFSQKN